MPVVQSKSLVYVGWADHNAEADDRLLVVELFCLALVHRVPIHLCLEGQTKLTGNIESFHRECAGFLKKLNPELDIDDWQAVKHYLSTLNFFVYDMRTEKLPSFDRTTCTVVHLIHGSMDVLTEGLTSESSFDEFLAVNSMDPSDTFIFQGIPTLDQTAESAFVGGSDMEIEELLEKNKKCQTYNYKLSNDEWKKLWLLCYYSKEGSAFGNSIFFSGGPKGTSAIYPTPEWMEGVCDLGFELLDPYREFIVARCCCTTPVWVNDDGDEYMPAFTAGIAYRLIGDEVVDGSNLKPITVLMKDIFGLDYSLTSEVGEQEAALLELARPLPCHLLELFCVENEPLVGKNRDLFIDAYMRIMSGRALAASYIMENRDTKKAMQAHVAILDDWLQNGLPNEQNMKQADYIMHCVDISVMKNMMAQRCVPPSYDMSLGYAFAALLENDFATVKDMVEKGHFANPDMMDEAQMETVTSLNGIV